MQTVSGAKKLDYGMMYALEKANSINLENFNKFFSDLPTDPYLEGNYRFRRLSRFKVHFDDLIKLPHQYLFQSKQYNPLLGNVKRDYPELDDAIIELDDFRKLVLAFVDACKLNAEEIEIGVHQIRTICLPNNFGKPAPEGIHRDGVDFIGIFSVNRENIQGGETHLYVSRKEKPVFCKILNPGELLVANDREVLHFTTPIKPVASNEGIRDVFVLTFPDPGKSPD